VELERDYRLASRGYGRLQKLYKDEFNTRSGYLPSHTWAGVLKSATLEEETGLNAVTGGVVDDLYEQGTLFPGTHDIRIEAADFFGNTSTISARVLVGSAFLIQPLLSEQENDLVVEDVLTYDLKPVKRLEAYYLTNGMWRPARVSENSMMPVPDEKGGDTGAEPYNTQSFYHISRPGAGAAIMKLLAYDQFDAVSHPYYYIDAGGIQTSVQPKIEFEYDYYDDYLRIEIESNHILSGLPVLSLHTDRSDSVLTIPHQLSLKKYIGRFNLEYLAGREHHLKVHGQNLSGEPFTVVDTFTAQVIMPHRTARLYSEDRQFRVNFWSGSLFRPFYGRVEKISRPERSRYRFESDIFAVLPNDVLLDKGAFVQIHYPADEENPGQLGIYREAGAGNWRFVENRIDQASSAISAKVMDFSRFALIRDDAAPEITAIRPANGARLSGRTPRISASVRDKLSGIASETDIDIILDGRRLIAEYDPERSRVSYRCRQPLAAGNHHLTFRAKDKCGNVRIIETVFTID
jgi:hypothetical protein